MVEKTKDKGKKEIHFAFGKVSVTKRVKRVVQTMEANDGMSRGMTNEEVIDELYRLLSDCVSGYYPMRTEKQKERYNEAVKIAAENLADKEGAEASQIAKKSWKAEEIQKAADLLKERFMQNADFLFCSPEDEADIKKTVGDRFKVKGRAGIEPGRIYLVDRNEVEKWRPRLFSEQEETT